MKDYTKLNQGGKLQDPTHRKQDSARGQTSASNTMGKMGNTNTMGQMDHKASQALLVKKLAIITTTLGICFILYQAYTSLTAERTPAPADKVYTENYQHTVEMPPIQPAATAQPDQTNQSFEAVLKEYYKMTNVEYVEFSPERSNLSKYDTEYLTALFHTTDILVVARISNQIYLQRNMPLHLESYDVGLKALNSLIVPPRMKEAHAKILTAVSYQKLYFEQLQKTKGDFNSSHPYVQQSSAALIQAYNIMAAEYKNEESRNIYSFEKHLCALDFI